MNRFLEFFRNIFESIRNQDLVNRIGEYFRRIDEDVILTPGLNVTNKSAIPGVIEYNRSTSDNINIFNEISDLYEGTRNIRDGSSIRDGSVRTAYFFRVAIDNIEFQTIVDRFGRMYRNIIDTLSIEVIVDRLSFFGRIVQDDIVFNDLLDVTNISVGPAFDTYDREISEGFTIGSIINRFALFIREIVQSIVLTFTLPPDEVFPSDVKTILPNTNDVPYVQLNETLTFE